MPFLQRSGLAKKIAFVLNHKIRGKQARQIENLKQLENDKWQDLK